MFNIKLIVLFFLYLDFFVSFYFKNFQFIQSFHVLEYFLFNLMNLSMLFDIQKENENCNIHIIFNNYII